MTGSCLCQHIRYEISAEPLGTLLCHCEDCRKASGAPVVAWTFFPAGTLRFLSGEPKTIRHAERERSFCPRCGSPIHFFDPALPHIYEVTTCTLDDAAGLMPSEHNWEADRLPWFEMADNGPRFLHNSPPPGL